MSDTLRYRAQAAAEAEPRADRRSRAGKPRASERAHELANQLLVVQAGRAEAGELRRQVEAAQLAQAETEAEAEDLRQAAIVRQGRGLVARLRATWRARDRVHRPGGRM